MHSVLQSNVQCVQIDAWKTEARIVSGITFVNNNVLHIILIFCSFFFKLHFNKFQYFRVHTKFQQCDQIIKNLQNYQYELNKILLLNKCMFNVSTLNVSVVSIASSYLKKY